MAKPSTHYAFMPRIILSVKKNDLTETFYHVLVVQQWILYMPK